MNKPIIPWFKFSSTFFDDDKISLILKKPHGDEIVMIWIRLITLAMRSHMPGAFYIAESLPYRDQDLADYMGRPLETVRLAIETFSRLGMLVPDDNGAMMINDFERITGLTTYIKNRENTRKRVEKHRVTRYLPVTNKKVTPPEEEEELKNKNNTTTRRATKSPRVNLTEQARAISSGSSESMVKAWNMWIDSCREQRIPMAVAIQAENFERLKTWPDPVEAVLSMCKYRQIYRYEPKQKTAPPADIAALYKRYSTTGYLDATMRRAGMDADRPATLEDFTRRYLGAK